MSIFQSKVKQKLNGRLIMILIRKFIFFSFFLFILVMVVISHAKAGCFIIIGLYLDILGAWFISKEAALKTLKSRALCLAVNPKFYWKQYNWMDKSLFYIYRWLYLVPAIYQDSHRTNAQKKEAKIREDIGSFDVPIGFTLLFFGFILQVISYIA